MGFFMCSVPATPGNRTILKALDVQARIAFDHFHEVDGQLNFSRDTNDFAPPRVVRREWPLMP